MESIAAILGIALFVILISLSLAWRFSRSQSLLAQWASENGYTILTSEYRNFFRGPFFMRSSDGQTIYYVTLRDRDGHIRTGWVRCGGWWAGLFSNTVDVQWED